MTFSDFIKNAWQDHAEHSARVARDVSATGINLIENPEQMAQLASLILHVYGEHLADPSGASAALANLRKHPQFATENEGGQAVERATAAMTLASGQEKDLASFTRSEQIRILTSAATALSSSQPEKSLRFLERAIASAELGLERADIANRVLAITGNNIACACEEMTGRSTAATELMLTAASLGRRYWAIAGGWLEVKRAEYRLAKSNIAAGQSDQGLRHAQLSVELSRENSASEMDHFYAYEALALAEKMRGNKGGWALAREKAQEYFAKLSADDQKWCESDLNKLN